MFAARYAILVAVLFLIAGCTSEPEWVARVNGRPVSQRAYSEAVQRHLARYEKAGYPLSASMEERLEKAVLWELVGEEIVLQKATALGVTVTEGELEATFQAYRSRFATEEAFQDDLKSSYHTAGTLKAELRHNLLRERVLAELIGPINVADEEIQKYYDENANRFRELERARIARILLSVREDASEAEERAIQEEAEALLAKARAGEDFAALAKANSNSEEAVRGGELGWINRGQVAPELEKVVFDLQAGQISNLVRTAVGYEIVTVLERAPDRQTPLAEVRKEIEESLFSGKQSDGRRDVMQLLNAGVKIEPPSAQSALGKPDPILTDPPAMILANGEGG